MSCTPSQLVLLGHPVAHSLSPRFQNAALRAAGIPLDYRAVDVAPDQLTTTLDALRRAGGAGNVTVPHKQAALDLCDTLTSTAILVGAVNTFWSADNVLHGDNTDVAGFEAAAHTLLGETHRTRVALIGAGGAALAVAAAVAGWSDSRLLVYNRSPARADALAQRFANARVQSSLLRAVGDAQLVVNATPIGLDEPAFPVPIEMLAPHAAVLDLVYHRGETAWVRAAREAGHLAADGLTMLIEQGAAAFERWFGIAPDRDAMWRAVS